MTIPSVYRKSSDLNPSYDWIDATTGLGYRIYYACAGNHSSDVFFLTPNSAINANPNSSTGTNGATTGSYVDGVDVDFDVEFAKNAILQGTAYFNVTTKLSDFTGGDYMRVKITVYHYDGSTETSIGTSTSAVQTTTEYIRNCLKVDLTQKKFSSGDILRINVILEVKSGTASHTFYMFHDPSNRVTVDTDKPTTLICDIPFKVEL